MDYTVFIDDTDEMHAELLNAQNIENHNINYEIRPFKVVGITPEEVKTFICLNIHDSIELGEVFKNSDKNFLNSLFLLRNIFEKQLSFPGKQNEDKTDGLLLESEEENDRIIALNGNIEHSIWESNLALNLTKQLFEHASNKNIFKSEFLNPFTNEPLDW